MLVVLVILGILASIILGLSELRSHLLEDRKLKTRHVVEVAAGILGHYQALQAQGVLSEEDAKRQAVAAVRVLRYEKEEYFFINDLDNRSIMHPLKPELEGKDLSGFKDPDGKLFFTEFTRMVKKDEIGRAHV